MIRNLKAMGLALVAVFALSAMAASAASAASIQADGPFTLKGTDEGEPGSGSNILIFKEGEANGVECHNSHYHGEAVGGGDLSPGAETAKVTPTYEECTFAGLDATVTMNGCSYVLHLVGTNVSSDLSCPKGQHPTVHIYISHAAHTGDEPLCTIDITANQTELEGATLTDEENGHVTLGGTIEGIEGQKSGACGTASSTTGELRTAVTIEGLNESGEPGTSLSLE